MNMFRDGESFAQAEFIELRPGMRRKIEKAIEGLVALLDELDGDPDIEAEDEDDDCDLEPYLADSGSDLEGCAGAETEDDEPWLGSTEAANQTHWGEWSKDDREDEHDGSEPSLGATESIDQTRWSDSGASDREDEHDGREPEDDNGIADMDGLEEQWGPELFMRGVE